MSGFYQITVGSVAGPVASGARAGGAGRPFVPARPRGLEFLVGRAGHASSPPGRDAARHSAWRYHAFDMAKKPSSLSPPTYQFDQASVLAKLDAILEAELAGVVRYTHYSMMIFGYNRIPIVKWLAERADESLAHARKAGEMITHLGGHPSLAIGPLLETHKHEMGAILREIYAHERQATDQYQELLGLVQGKSVLFEEYAREMVREEELDLGEVDKMLRNPGDVERFAEEEKGGVVLDPGKRSPMGSASPRTK
jgi:bacterioferritin